MDASNLKLPDLPEIDLESEDFQQGIERADEVISPLRDGPGIARSQRGIEPLSYELAIDLIRDPRFSMGMKSRLVLAGITEGPAFDAFTNILFNREGADHTRIRLACAPWFSARGAEKLREEVRTWVDGWLDDLADSGGFELHTEIGRPLPSMVFCRLVGAPLEDADTYARLSESALLLSGPPHPDTRRIVEEAAAETDERVRTMIAERRDEPGEDLISFMLESERRGDISENDIVNVVFNVLVGSTDTTDTQICLNLKTLSEHPDQWELLKRQPEYLPNAVLECLRYSPGVWTVMRSPLERIEYRGIAVSPEDTLWPAVFSANRDPNAFEDPRRLDITRKFKQNPLNFGSGVHACLGRMISLLEQQEVLRAVVSRWQGFEVGDSEFTGAMYAQVVKRMHVSFALEPSPIPV